MIVVAIIGVLASLAIYGVRKYLLHAKGAEATQGVGRIAKDAGAAFDRERVAGAVLPGGDVAGVAHHLCQSAATVPSTKDSIKGAKYQSNPVEWSASGWSCLLFSMRDPQYFMYSYSSSGTAGAIGDSFTAIANGDLNGDGVTSTIFLAGVIDGTVGQEVVKLAPNFGQVSPEE